MVEALKKIDKKVLIIVGIVLLLPILLIIFLAVLQGCSNSKITPEKYEEKMISAAESYFEDKDMIPSGESETESVKLSTLVKKEYIKSTEDLLGDNSCSGSVIVRRNGSTVLEDEDGFLNYTVSLNCKDYKTTSLKDYLMEDLTTEGSGLYLDNGYYVFKGEDVKNYITFFGNSYRIINIDSEGIIKLLKVEPESLDNYWDNKYNTEVQDSYGKNIYSDSAILKKMLSDYQNVKVISSEAKEHIVSSDVCVDFRDINNTTIGNYSCSNKLENQVISLIDVSDFAKASLDPECNNIYSKSCSNYNYLKTLNLKTWTPIAVSNNTYEVYYLSNGIIKIQEASKYQNYNIVIHIDGNEKVTSGKGTVDSPYVIE